MGRWTVMVFCLGWACTASPGAPEAGTRPVEAREVPEEAQVVYEAVETSVHELIVCGGMQRNLVAPMALRVVMGADGLLDPEAQQDIEEAAELVGYDLDGGGFVRDGVDWRLPMGASTFDVRFLHEGAPVDGDVFALDSYVTGVVATSDRDWGAMLDDPQAVTTFRFAWEEEGELAALMAPIPNPIVVEASLMDLGLLALGLSDGGGELGAFERLGALRTVGHVPFVDEVGAVEVSYDAELDGTVEELTRFGTAAVEVDRLSASWKGWSLEVVDVAVAAQPGALAGVIDHELVSPTGEVWTVSADFGDGAAWPEVVTWGCVGC